VSRPAFTQLDQPPPKPSVAPVCVPVCDILNPF
jgi:hypothetical protein